MDYVLCGYARALLAGAFLAGVTCPASAHELQHFNDEMTVVGLVGEGRIYIEATYDPAIGEYVYPERIEVQEPYNPYPVTYRASRVIYPGDPDYPYHVQHLEPWTPEWMDHCAQKYRSFNARTGKYRTYSGRLRMCR